MPVFFISSSNWSFELIVLELKMATNTSSIFGSLTQNNTRTLNTSEIDANGKSKLALLVTCFFFLWVHWPHRTVKIQKCQMYIFRFLFAIKMFWQPYTNVFQSIQSNWLWIHFCVSFLPIFIGIYLYEVPIGIIVLLSIFYGSISIIAVIGNSLVIWIVATTRAMQTVTNLFIANLALADVVIGMFVIPFQVIIN